MKNLFKSLLGLLASLVITTGAAQAQTNPYRIFVIPSAEVTSVSTNITAVSTAPVLVVKYTGATTQANTFAVTTLDYIFTVAGAADATITGCGGTPGTLDTGTAPCTTIAGLVGRIHASPNWTAVIYGALAADSTTAAGGSPVADVTAVITPAAGTPTFNLSSTSLQTTVGFTPSNTVDIRDFLQGGTGTGAASGGAFRVAPNYWAGQRTSLVYSLSNIASTAGAASSFNCAKTTYNRDGSVTEVNRVLFGFTQAASGVDKIFDFGLTGGAANIFCNPGERLLARYVTTVTHTAPVVRITGYVQPVR